jgi:steroid 5-alpha reductase family enzyme
MITTLLTSAGIIWAHATLWFFISLWKKRNDVADIAWGLGYVVLALYLYFSFPASPVDLVVYGLVAIWGIRLALHIGLRTRKKTEDFRYKQWREEWGKSFLVRSYLQVYILQAGFLLIIATPLFIVSQNEVSTWSWLSYGGIILWMVGFCFQAVGDFQLSQFKKKPQNKGHIIQSGLWKYSRHPNYFGEICMWWGVFLIVLHLPYGWLGIISPLTITLLLVFVSGIPMLEKKYEGNPEFEAYKQKTSALIPWLPKKG